MVPPYFLVNRCEKGVSVPLSEYFKGDGKKILADFVKRYGEAKGKRMFYATANKRGLAPKRKVKRKRK